MSCSEAASVGRAARVECGPWVPSSAPVRKGELGAEETRLDAIRVGNALVRLRFRWCWLSQVRLGA